MSNFEAQRNYWIGAILGKVGWDELAKGLGLVKCLFVGIMDASWEMLEDEIGSRDKSWRVNRRREEMGFWYHGLVIIVCEGRRGGEMGGRKTKDGK